MTAFEPRKVEPKALRRWLKQGAALACRSVPTWLLSGLLFLALASWCVHSYLLLMALGLWVHVHFQALAQRSDHGDISVAKLPDYLGSSLLEAGNYCKRLSGMILANTVPSVVVLCLLTGLNPVYVSAPLTEGASAWGASDLAGLGLALALGSLLLVSGIGFATHGYLLTRYTGANASALQSLTRRQRAKNGWLGVQFDLVLYVSAMLAIQFPPLLVVFTALAGACSYVSFRDIYLHQDGNLALSKAPSAKLAAGAAV